MKNRNFTRILRLPLLIVELLMFHFTLTVLFFDGISIIPILTSFTMISVCIVETILTDSCHTVACIWVRYVDIGITIAGLTEITWYQKNNAQFFSASSISIVYYRALSWMKYFNSLFTYNFWLSIVSCSASFTSISYIIWLTFTNIRGSSATGDSKTIKRYKDWILKS